MLLFRRHLEALCWLAFATILLSFSRSTHAQGVTQREIVLQAMHLRPLDPWPRGTGHVVYAVPGILEEQKGYEEPGGSLSPSVSSFGVSIWVLDPKSGAPVQTSDSIPLGQIKQRYVWTTPGRLPNLEVETPGYTATWSVVGNGGYSLAVRPKANQPLAICIRSVGPAGGPIHRLVWNDHRLTVNDLWKLDGSNVSLLALGHEGDSGWTRARNAQARWQGDDGWGYALLGLRSPTRNILRINLSHAESHSELEASSATATFVAQLPDPRFMQSLNSQVVNLMMGLVDDQTRPGDPTNYPLAWLRDGAYVVVGLARAGQLEIAKKLAVYFAKHDFFGGFGPEADAPGLSLWVIETVANLAKDPNFDRAVWPDVERKASFIIAMRHAVRPIHQDPFGPIVPAYVHDKDLSLVCDPSKDGLIMGRMDWERPVLFINAVSYQGLEAAADFAQRLGAGNQEKQWRKEAAEAQLTWRDALANPRYEDDRTYISTLWPTWAGSGVEAEYKSLLTTHWDKSHNADGQYKSVPLWTYFDIADAHQWLYLGEPARTWKTLDWFWEHQSSVGLYTWWEGNGEENSFGRWRNIRGWVNPPNVTPHYWTASEMLLLQIDILGYADSSGKEPVIVVGAGIPRDWIKSDMSVRGVSTELGLVDWRWSNKELTVTVHGSHAKVRAGTSFGDSAKVLVRYVELGT